jgi:hypothetical protein
MIWGKGFVWTHIGRTGGYTVDRMCRILEDPEIHLDPLDGEWSRWKRHQTIEQREAATGLDLKTGKSRLTGFRRLPSWLLSFAEYKKKNEGLDFTDEQLTRGMLRVETRDLATGRLDPTRPEDFHADSVLRYYDVPGMDGWLRTEHLPDDFMTLMARWYTITPAQEQQIRAARENGNQYRDLWSRFSREQVRKMYESCPVWTELERKLYGDLLA